MTRAHGRTAAIPSRVRAGQLAALSADLKRYGRRPFLREPAVYAVALYRIGRWNDRRRATFVGRTVVRLAYLVAYFAVRSSLGIEIPKEADIGPGLRIHHQGPIVIHPDAVIGPGCTLRHGVTIGERKRGAGVPVIGSNVEIGAFAQLLGPISIGSDVSIGALALVIADVPDESIVIAQASVGRPRKR